jgi:hypothetical protein
VVGDVLVSVCVSELKKLGVLLWKWKLEKEVMTESGWMFEDGVWGMRRGSGRVGDERSAANDGRGAGRDEGTPVRVVG